MSRVLPPSLAGLGIQAEIRYHIKVTVHRPSRFKGNKRSERPFRFIPFDPPKILTSSKEVYARRPYIFRAGPRGEVYAHLPSPAVLTWDQNIPLRIILRKSDENEEQLYLAFLQLRLFDFTEIRASDVVRVKTNARTILSLDGLAIPILTPSEMDTMLDSSLWDRLLLPSTVEPSFETCNLRRTYDLEVGVGLRYRGAQNAQAQTVFVPHFQIWIFSGTDVSLSFGDAQSDSPLPPTYDSSSKPENNATEEVDPNELSGYEDAATSNAS
ncbi:hypothetical protein BGZ57DRAFT_980755 [Hyaloscypha finlandica]|nr:hypothetical protein BGZ57DRAFT_980755 [Hyaloscypha finlandica]